MRGWSITRCAFAACKHAHATLAALTPCAPVAQRLEQQTHNLLVRGSNPCGGTNKIKELGAAPLLPFSLMCAYSVPVRLKRMFSSLSVAAFCLSAYPVRRDCKHRA